MSDMDRWCKIVAIDPIEKVKHTVEGYFDDICKAKNTELIQRLSLSTSEFDIWEYLQIPKYTNVDFQAFGIGFVIKFDDTESTQVCHGPVLPKDYYNLYINDKFIMSDDEVVVGKYLVKNYEVNIGVVRSQEYTQNGITLRVKQLEINVYE